MTTARCPLLCVGCHMSQVWLLNTNPSHPSITLLTTLAGGHRNAVKALAFTPDSAHIVSGAEDGVNTWHLRNHSIFL